MIEVNLLLDTSGRLSDSFVRIDVMRLPLGILTGMGFIGGGAILRRGDTITGVTTAATLWFATVLGLCFGAGLHGLGLAALVLGVVILWSLKRLELRIPQEHRAVLTLTVAENGPSEEEIRSGLTEAGYRICSWDLAARGRGESRQRRIRSELHWQGKGTEPMTPEFVRRLVNREGIASLRWKG
jgi:putative Mg2+ transporter-C (MgtC) family protein